MSDVTGRDALEMILDRMDDKASTVVRIKRGRDEAHREWSTAQRRVEELERDLARERARPKAPTTAGDAGGEIPF